MSKKQELQTMYPEGKSMVIGCQEFKIKPFVLKNRMRIVSIFAEVFVELNKHTDGGKVDNVAMIPKFLNTAGDRIIEVYEVVLNKERAWLEENVQLRDEVELIKTVMEINDFPFLVSQVKQMIAAAKASQ